MINAACCVLKLRFLFSTNRRRHLTPSHQITWSPLEGRWVMMPIACLSSIIWANKYQSIRSRCIEDHCQVAQVLVRFSSTFPFESQSSKFSLAVRFTSDRTKNNIVMASDLIWHSNSSTCSQLFDCHSSIERILFDWEILKLSLSSDNDISIAVCFLAACHQLQRTESDDASASA